MPPAHKINPRIIPHQNMNSSLCLAMGARRSPSALVLFLEDAIDTGEMPIEVRAETDHFKRPLGIALQSGREQ